MTKRFPDGTQQVYAYQPQSGRLLSVTDAKSQVATFTYTIDDRLASVAYSNATVTTPGTSWSYDPIFPRLTAMADGIGTTNYAYFALTANPQANPLLGAGQVQSIDGPWANDTITMTYDQLGRPLTQSINGAANSSSVVYDTLGRLDALTNGLGSFDYQYVGSTGRLDRVIYPNSQKAIFSYLTAAQDFRLSGINNQKPAGTNLSTFSYAYDVLGRITTWTRQNDAAASTAFTLGYDNADQLVSAVLKQGATVQNEYGYSYDKSSNRIGWRKDALTVGETANTLNQVTGTTAGGPIEVKGNLDEPGTVTVNGQATPVNPDKTFRAEVPANPAGSTTVTVVATDLKNNVNTKQWQFNGLAPTPRVITYDLNGNTVNDGSRTYTWDAKDQLATIDWVSGGNALRTEFTYNGLGQRVKMVEKTNGAVTSTITYLWVNGQIAEERDSTGATVAKRYLSGGMMVGATKYFFTGDHLGSVREVTDNSGNVVSRFDYDLYGNRTQVSGTFDPGMGFTGHFHHSSGLVLTWFRAYDPQTARWLSRDPIAESGGINLYAYAGGDPINQVDPLGLTVRPGAWEEPRPWYWPWPLPWDPSPFRRPPPAPIGPPKGAPGDTVADTVVMYMEWALKECPATGGVLPPSGIGLKILEVEGNVIRGSFQGANGEARFVTEVVKDGETLILRGTHVEGSATLKEGLEAARQLGRQEGASNVIVEGGRRTTGANPGHTPRPITVPVNP
jgi:RHS repeat-associated protein